MKKYLWLLFLLIPLLLYPQTAGRAIHGSSLEFDGGNNRGVNCGHDNSLSNIFDSGGSVIADIALNSDGQNDMGRIYSKSDRWEIYVLNEGAEKVTLRLLVYFDGAGNGAWDTSTRVINIRQWTTIEIIYNSGNVSNNPIFHINGVEYTVGDGLTEVSTPVGTRMSDTDVDLQLGRKLGSLYVFDGYIDNFQIYTRALESIERAWLDRHPGAVYNTNNLVGWWKFNEFTGITAGDSSGEGNDGTLVNAPLWSIQTPVGVAQ